MKITIENLIAKLGALPCDGTIRDADGNVDVDVLRTCIRFEKEDAEAFLDTL